LPIKARGAMVLHSYRLLLFFQPVFQLSPSSPAIGDAGRPPLLFVPPFAIGYWLL
jgi:hypothetical protein